MRHNLLQMLGNICTFLIISTYRFTVPAYLIKFDIYIGKLLARALNVFLILVKSGNIVPANIVSDYKRFFIINSDNGKCQGNVFKVKCIGYFINTPYFLKRNNRIFCTVNVHGLLVDIYIKSSNAFGLRILCKFSLGYLSTAKSAEIHKELVRICNSISYRFFGNIVCNVISACIILRYRQNSRYRHIFLFFFKNTVKLGSADMKHILKIQYG